MSNLAEQRMIISSDDEQEPDADTRPEELRLLEALLFAAGALCFETMQVRWSAEFVVAITWLVFALSLGAIWLLYFLIRHRAAARVVSLFYLTPPFTALMAWLLFDERLSLPALAGMAVCVVGVAMVNWRSAARAVQ